MFDKIWQDHLVRDSQGDTSLIYIDLHLVHEVTSPQAFAALRENKRTVRCPQKTVATMDHNVSTRTKDINKVEATSRTQMDTLSNNCHEFGVKLYDFADKDQGIVHVIGPEQGLTPSWPYHCLRGFTYRDTRSFWGIGFRYRYF